MNLKYPADGFITTIDVMALLMELDEERAAHAETKQRIYESYFPG